MDILLDLGTGDAVFTNGGTTVTSDITEAVMQRLFITLKTFEGEWYLNTDHGIPYFQSILGAKNSKEAIDLIFQQKILQDPDVQAITEFTSTLGADRQYTLSFKITVRGVTSSITNIQIGV